MRKKNNLVINEKKLKKEDVKSKWYKIYMKKKPNQTKPDWVPEPLKKKCFQCKSNILIKFVVPNKDYSQKNSWSYWTEKNQDQGKYICDGCLFKLYNNKILYWKTITSPKKKQRMRTYVFTGTISS